MSQYVRYPNNNSILQFPNFGAFPALALNGTYALDLSTYILYVFESGTLTWVATASPTALIPMDVGVFDGQAPAANGATINSNHLYMQSATAAVPGLVNIGTQTFAGNKTFTGTIAASNLSGTNTGDVTLTAVGVVPNANGASLSGQILTLQPANTSFPGVLLAADWNTFNNKQPAGSYITALTGDVTAAGPGSAAATIATGAVTDTKASLANKPALTVAATTNQTLSGLPTIDGITLVDGSTPLLTAQSTPSQNGPWVSHVGAWTRPTWYPSGGTTQSFQFITALIRLGTTYQGSTWRMTTAGAITIDTTSTTWVVTPLAINSSTVTGTIPASIFPALTGDISTSAGSLTTAYNGTVPINKGGTGQTTANAAFAALSPQTTNGDLITRAAGVPARLAVGTNGQVLTVVSGLPAWAAAGVLTVSSISSNTSVVSGTTYLCDTSGAAFTVTLPTPTSGAIIFLKDKTGSFQTNNLTVAQSAAEKIEGLAASKLLQTNWGAWGFFSDGTDWYMGPF